MFRAILIFVLISMGGCAIPRQPQSQTNQRIFQVKGVIVELKPEDKTIQIKHEAIPDYMGAMTMPFTVKSTNELAGLNEGDSVSFRMVVTDKEGWIEQIKKLKGAETNILPAGSPFRIVRDVEPLKEGDLLPEYHFTNELGKAVSTKQFNGQALAITFLFTRCPFPDFCPLMANNFGAVQKKLMAMTNAPANWRLLTISFDPEFDKPVVLKSYAQHFKYDPARWSFLTGDLIEITAIADQLGLTFMRDDTGSISHNLRTAIIDTSGRVQKIFVGNKWTSDELVGEIIKAAAVRRE